MYKLSTQSKRTHIEGIIRGLEEVKEASPITRELVIFVLDNARVQLYEVLRVVLPVNLRRLQVTASIS